MSHGQRRRKVNSHCHGMRQKCRQTFYNALAFATQHHGAGNRSLKRWAYLVLQSSVCVCVCVWEETDSHSASVGCVSFSFVSVRRFSLKKNRFGLFRLRCYSTDRDTILAPLCCGADTPFWDCLYWFNFTGYAILFDWKKCTTGCVTDI